jgi:hypothetical protein
LNQKEIHGKERRTMGKIATMAMLCAATTVGSVAQEPTDAKLAAEQLAAIQAKVQLPRVAVEGRLTKNAPYSAEAVTESVQLLADGNRIVTRNSTRVFRDSDARTRREQLTQAGTDVVNITISDPVAGNTYILDPATHTVYRNGLIITTPTGMATASVAHGGRGTVSVFHSSDGAVTVAGAEQKEAGEAQAGKLVDEMKVRSAIGAGGAGFVVAGELQAKVAAVGGQTTREDLGQQTIEGVTATGTRTTTEIPAGAIGNDQPIKIVSEQWFSPELQVLVLTKHSDPRTGETTYRLTGIVRAEPVRSLFELPPDYTLKESPIRREMK